MAPETVTLSTTSALSMPTQYWLWRTLCDGFAGCVRRGVVLLGLVVVTIGSVILVSHFFPI
jgi:hypothetical protein